MGDQRGLLYGTTAKSVEFYDNIDLSNPFEEKKPYPQKFWNEVKALCSTNKDWKKSLLEVQIKGFKELSGGITADDDVLAYLFKRFDNYTEKVKDTKDEDKMQKMPSFIQAVKALCSTNKDWKKSLLEVQIKGFKELSGGITADDDVLAYLFKRFDNYTEKVKDTKDEDKMQKMPSFIQAFTNTCVHIIEADYKKGKEDQNYKYKEWIKGSRSCVLHLAARHDLVGIAKCILACYPKLCSNKDEYNKLPLQIAMEHECDSTAYLIAKKTKKNSIRGLFQSKGKEASAVSFGEMCKKGIMKKTMEVILDSLYEAHFDSPLPKNTKDVQEYIDKVKDEPRSYNFYYRTLDGDGEGRSPTITDLQTGTTSYNSNFLKWSDNGLYHFAYGPLSENLISHPVIRQLIKRKWKAYGWKIYSFSLMFYLLYLMVMSLAFFLGVHGNRDLNVYKTSNDIFRCVCEVLTIIAAILYLIYEVELVIRLGMLYKKDPFNFLHLIGVLLTISWYLTKWIEDVANAKTTTVQWSLAAVAFLFSAICVFRFFSANKTLGVYIRTFMQLIYQEIIKFMLVFIVVVGAFTGSVVLGLKATNGFGKASMTPVSILFQEIRALFQSQGFADKYIGLFSIGVIILLMLNMLSIIIILANVLIGQINNAYNSAEEKANTGFDIDLLHMMTRFDRGSFLTIKKRIEKYVDFEFVSDATTIEDLFKEWKKMKNTTVGNACCCC